MTDSKIISKDRDTTFPDQLISAYDLMRKKLPKIEWVIDRILPSGLALLAARPKTGKSFLALNISVDVSSGRNAIETFPTTKCNVLYISNEDSLNRLKERLTKIFIGKNILPDSEPKNFMVLTEFPKLNKGGLELLNELIKKYDFKLVIVDTFFKSYDYPETKKNAYTIEYEMTGEFQSFAQSSKICLMFVHHTKKSESAYVFDNVLGTTGITGSADTIWILESNQQQTTLEITGKDVEGESIQIQFDKANCIWKAKDSNKEMIGLTPERKEIYELLKIENREMQTSEIAERLGKKDSNISMIIKKMVSDGYIRNPKYGFYIINH